MKLKTLIIDDEPDALDKLRSYIETVPFLELVAECQGTTEALEYMVDHEVDLIFTDIEMPDINGISFMESLTTRTMVVFTTAYSEYAVDGFRVSAIDYLVKPYRLIDFHRAANKCLEVWRNRHPAISDSANVPEAIFIKVETRFERIWLRDIRYIKGYGEYLQVYTAGSRFPLMTISSFQSIITRLPQQFQQIHRSYIVNIEHIARIERMRIYMDDDTVLPIGATYRDKFFEYLSGRTIGKIPKISSETGKEE